MQQISFDEFATEFCGATSGPRFVKSPLLAAAANWTLAEQERVDDAEAVPAAE